MTQHTQGPWEVHINEDGNPVDVYAVEGRKSIAKLAVYNPDRKANAAMIAAAPDLLEAANYLLDDMRLREVPTNCVQKLIRAIAKAEGNHDR